MLLVDLPDDALIDILTFLDEEWHTIRDETLAALRL